MQPIMKRLHFFILKIKQGSDRLSDWATSVKAKRKALKITQDQLAIRLGITRQYLQRVEAGNSNASSSLQMQIDQVLNRWTKEPELNLIFDYVRIRFPSHDAETLIKNILQLQLDYMLFEDWAYYGYSAKYVFSNIQVMISPPADNLGTLVELKGQGCREFEGILLTHGETWFDFFRICMKENATFKRIDLAINDMAGLLDIPELIAKCDRNECISVMRRFQGLQSGPMNDSEKNDKGATLYIGSMKSDIYFCIYEKAAEQSQKFGINPDDYAIKNRFEIRLKNDRAALAIENLLIYRDVEKTAFGIITRYLRFVDYRANQDRTKWPLNKMWQRFCGKNRQPLRLTLAPEPFDLRKTKAWIQKQVAPMLKVLFKIDAFNGTTETMTMIKSVELQKRHLKLLEQQTIITDEIGGDFFE